MKIVELWLAIFSAGCWPICFLWMYRIGARQEEMLSDLNKQAKRIENLSKAEHDLIKEVHPQVEKIKDGVEELARNQ
jgi:cell division protein FtsB